ncbi:MAG: extensin family protein [Paracoccaceae bacterium]
MMRRAFAIGAAVFLGHLAMSGPIVFAAEVPVSRPVTESPRKVQAVTSEGARTDETSLAFKSPIPKPRPSSEQIPPPRVTAPAKGKLICEDPRLVGTRAQNVIGHLPGCGILNPVKIREIAGVKLSSPATLDCRTARTFANWVSGVAQPEARRTLGARISKIWLMGTYTCRTRNNRPGARVSEHGAGRAIDVGGFWLGNGQRVTVLGNWGQGAPGKFLRSLWKKACGPFTTVLGPGADRFHQDHLHLDTAYRSSRYCR